MDSEKPKLHNDRRLNILVSSTEERLYTMLYLWSEIMGKDEVVIDDVPHIVEVFEDPANGLASSLKYSERSLRVESTVVMTLVSLAKLGLLVYTVNSGRLRVVRPEDHSARTISNMSYKLCSELLSKPEFLNHMESKLCPTQP